jgi:Fibronectin type III domain
MTTFTSAPFNLPAGTLIQAKVRAHNKIGWSDFSDLNTAGILAQTPPTQMSAPTRNASTTIAQLVFDWVVPSSDGYSPVTSYNVQWDQGTQGTQWANLTGYNIDSIVFNYKVSSGIYAGDFYQIRVRAKNRWGWGPFSPVLTIKAATMPAKMATYPSTSIDP